MKKWKVYGMILALACILMLAPVSACHATITKDAPTEVCSNCPFTYTLHVTYSGYNNYDIKVKDQLPAGVTDVVASDGGVFDSGTNTVTWKFYSVNDGWNKDLTITVTPEAPGNLENQAFTWIKSHYASTWDSSSLLRSNVVISEVIPCTPSPEFPTMAIPAVIIIGVILTAGNLKRKGL